MQEFLKEMISIRLRKGKQQSIDRKHPWVFSGALHLNNVACEDGELVYVENEFGERLGYGHYHKGSITVRLIYFGTEDYTPDIWSRLIANAWNYRANINLIDNAKTNCFRWVHGEGDQLSGLIIDVYDKIVVIQCHSIGMHKNLNDIVEAIKKIAKERVHSIILKSKETLPKEYSKQVEDKMLYGTESTCMVLENGISFWIDVLNGQKTGFFLDQRENRKLLGQYSKSKNVLNTFCYTGGFSMYALSNEANSVCSIDVSKKAMEIVERNEQYLENKIPHEKLTADVIEYLKQMEESKFDIIILDPPAFAKSLDKRHQAIQAYKRINLLALKNIKTPGFLFTFSCSQVVTEELFYKTIVSAGIESGKKIRVVQKLSQGPDHPISLFHAEGSYLKGLILEVNE